MTTRRPRPAMAGRSFPLPRWQTGISTTPNITTQFSRITWPSRAANPVTCWWLARQNDTTTTKLIANASSDGPFVSLNAWQAGPCLGREVVHRGDQQRDGEREDRVEEGDCPGELQVVLQVPTWPDHGSPLRRAAPVGGVRTGSSCQRPTGNGPKGAVGQIDRRPHFNQRRRAGSGRLPRGSTREIRLAAGPAAGSAQRATGQRSRGGRLTQRATGRRSRGDR